MPPVGQEHGDRLDMNERFDIPTAALIHYKEIDLEHQALVEILNSLTHAFGENNQLNGALFYEQAIQFLHAFEHHSANEEKEMADLAFPGLAIHRKHHANSIDKVQQIANEALQRPFVIKSSFFELFDRLIDELLRDDILFREFLDGRGL